MAVPLGSGRSAGAALVESTVEVDGRAARVLQRRATWTRHPGDLLRVGAAGMAVLLWVGVVLVAAATWRGLQLDLSTALSSLPGVLVTLVYSLYGLAVIVAPTVLLGWVLVRRRWRLLGVYLLTTAVTSLVNALTGQELTEMRPATAALPRDAQGVVEAPILARAGSPAAPQP